MRARCLGAHLAALAQLDSVATAAAGHYDEDFREPARQEDDTWAGSPGRINQAEIRVPCQIADEVFNRLDPTTSGFETQHQLKLTFSFRDLERAGFIDASTKVAGIRVTAQLLGIYDRRANLLYDMSADNIYCTETRPAAFMNASVNLLICTFACREKGIK